jgi:hypothetical protein
MHMQVGTGDAKGCGRSEQLGIEDVQLRSLAHMPEVAWREVIEIDPTLVGRIYQTR